MNLYINACAREQSRTDTLAKYLIKKIDEEFIELNLNKENVTFLNEDKLKQRDELIFKKDYSSLIFDYAKQFADADKIIISAPYWDLSFPAILKMYIENINVLGLTFSYSDKGVPVGLCKAKKLYYITTSGGPIVNDDFGYGYIKALSNMLYGIKETYYIKAQGLDIYNADIDKILSEAKKEIDNLK